MTRRRLILGALVAIAFMQGDSMSAQIIQEPSARGDVMTTAMPMVLSGPDVGFRVFRMERQVPVGEIVVRINGTWVTAQLSPQAK
jgi:hypothetical protein